MERFIEPLVRAGISESTIEDILCKIDEAQLNEADADDSLMRASMQAKAKKEDQIKANKNKQLDAASEAPKLRREQQGNKVKGLVKELKKLAGEHFKSKVRPETNAANTLNNLRNEQNKKNFEVASKKLDKLVTKKYGK